MRVVAKPRLREFWEKHGAAEAPLKAYWRIATDQNWKSVTELRRTFPQADAVTLNCGGRSKQPKITVTIFNIGGNKYRLVTRIYYPFGRIYIKKVMTHKEYSLDLWKDETCREAR